MDVDALLAEMDEAIEGKGKATAGRSATSTYSTSATSRPSTNTARKLQDEYKTQPAAAAAKASPVERIAHSSSAAVPAASRGGKQQQQQQPMDDLDTLLSSMDELISTPSHSHHSSTTTTTAASTTRRPTAASPTAATATTTTPLRPTPSKPVAATTCSPVILHSSAPTAPPACPRLLCLSCDHRVLSVADGRFTAQADYLFLRTTVPDVGKLRERMERSEGAMGWCCQCMYVNVESGATVRVDGARSGKCRWICTGHTK